MFRVYQSKAAADGTANISISPEIDAMEWDVYQISVQTQNQVDACRVQVMVNGFFLCGTSQGFLDCATGPPDAVITGKDHLTIMWFEANPGDLCQAAIWYNENPTGSTYSTAH